MVWVQMKLARVGEIRERRGERLGWNLEELQRLMVRLKKKIGWQQGEARGNPGKCVVLEAKEIEFFKKEEKFKCQKLLKSEMRTEK